MGQNPDRKESIFAIAAPSRCPHMKNSSECYNKNAPWD
jgi:hypothetical protein